MKFSLRKKMFLISMTSTLVSFLLILICFNLICSEYIKKETYAELHSAASITATKAVTPTIDLTINTDVAVKDLGEVNMLITDTTQTATPDAVSIQLEKSPVYDPSISFKVSEIDTIKAFALTAPMATATKATINESNYYLLATPVNEQTTAVFYKNVQSLEDLVSDVNIALFFLLVLCAFITIGTSMGLSSGMIRSIKKLCAFAGEIGKGNFDQKNLSLQEKELSILAEDMNQMARRLS